MNRKTLFTLCAATVLASTTALGIVMAKPASLVGSTEWRGETSTDWNTASNWSGNAVPEAGWTVAVGPNVTIATKGSPVLSSGAAGEAGDLTIVSGFSVTVTGNTLTLDGAVQHDIDGDIFLTISGSNSVLKVTGADATLDITGKIVLEASNAVLDLDADVTASGTGEIKGEHDSAEIQIADGVTFTNNVDIVGKMTVKESGTTGTFLNGSTGIVRANANGTLLLKAGLALDDDCDASWEATEASGNGILKFEATTVFVDSNPNLRGDFVLSGCSTIDFDGQDVKTSGSFASPSGCIVNVSGKFFYLNAGTCESPTSYTEVTGSQSFDGCSC